MELLPKMRDTYGVADLVGRLVAFGVNLPEPIPAGADHLRKLPLLKERITAVQLPTMLTLDEAGVEQALLDLAARLAIRSEAHSSGPAAQAVTHMRAALAEEVADALLAQADPILDQLRPKFDAAATSVHEATKLGIHTGTTDRDIVKGDNVAALADAWTSLPSHVDQLERIAGVRMDLTAIAGLPPRLQSSWTNPNPAIHEVAGAMFRPDGPAWQIDVYEPAWQRWLRLCTGAPAQLLAVEASEQAWEHVRVDYSPLVSEHPEEVTL